MTERIVLKADDISRALTRIAHQIVEANRGSDDVVLLGIPTRGVPLATRIAENIASIERAQGRIIDVAALSGSLDVTMHRDDLRRRPLAPSQMTRVPLSGIDDRIVVLVDDVLFSGRTVRAALDALGDIGRPRAVQLAVLADRGHRELPIRADYVGKNLPSARSERIDVRLAEIDGIDEVTIRDADDAASASSEAEA